MNAEEGQIKNRKRNKNRVCESEEIKEKQEKERRESEIVCQGIGIWD